MSNPEELSHIKFGNKIASQIVPTEDRNALVEKMGGAKDLKQLLAIYQNDTNAPLSIKRTALGYLEAVTNAVGALAIAKPAIEEESAKLNLEETQSKRNGHGRK